MSGVTGVSGKHRRVAAVARQPILARCDRPRDTHGVPDPRSDPASCHWRPPKRPRRVDYDSSAPTSRRTQRCSSLRAGRRTEGADQTAPRCPEYRIDTRAERKSGTSGFPCGRGQHGERKGANAASGNSLVTVRQILTATDRRPVCEEAAPHGTAEDRPIAECRLMIRGVWSIPTRRTGQHSVADVVCGGCGRFGSWRRDVRGGSTCDRFRRIGDSSRARCGRAGECRRCTASWIST